MAIAAELRNEKNLAGINRVARQPVVRDETLSRSAELPRNLGQGIAATNSVRRCLSLRGHYWRLRLRRYHWRLRRCRAGSTRLRLDQHRFVSRLRKRRVDGQRAEVLLVIFVDLDRSKELGVEVH